MARYPIQPIWIALQPKLKKFVSTQPLEKKIPSSNHNSNTPQKEVTVT
jgi:hypothetical protein